MHSSFCFFILIFLSCIKKYNIENTNNSDITKPISILILLLKKNNKNHRFIFSMSKVNAMLPFGHDQKIDKTC